MSNKIMLGAVAIFACGIAGYLACSSDDADSGRTSELQLSIQPEVEFPLRDNPSTRPSSILIAVSGVSAHHMEEGWVDIWATASIDLLAPEQAIPTILNAARMPEGVYDQLRFDVVYAGVRIDRKWYPLEIPSGDESGFKVNTRFCMVEGDATSVELDWDVADSLHYSEERGYWLTPAIETFSPRTCADDLRTPPRS